MALDIASVAIHPSVDAVFPPAVLEHELADVPIPVVAIDDDPSELENGDAIVTFSYREWFLERAAWIHSIQSGVDRFPFDDLREASIALTNSTGIHGESVGETVTGYMLSIARRLHRHRWNQQHRRWDRPAWDDPFTLNGELVTIVGLGTLGQGVAQRASALEMIVHGVRRDSTPVDGVENLYGPNELEAAVTDARFVVSTLPLTEATENFFDAAVFNNMRADGYFINVGRGGLVDEPALIDALESGHIAGAALDVFETEPLPVDSPLWEMESVIITPHTAAQTRDYYRDIAEIVRDNIERVTAGEPLYNRVM